MVNHLYAKALLKWGLDAQLDMAQEECAELIMAINKLRRSKYRRKSFVAEEIADVRIMINQIVLGLEIQKQVDKFNDLKMARLERRLKK
jgi:NTP pyrophosphatase (non-canonical NTP hydrolase)